jgi:hypothetical protein
VLQLIGYGFDEFFYIGVFVGHVLEHVGQVIEVAEHIAAAGAIFARKHKVMDLVLRHVINYRVYLFQQLIVFGFIAH